MTFAIAPLQLTDLPAVMEIDRLSFPHPWPETAHRSDLTQNQAARGLVALAPAGSGERQVIGYASWWLVADEAQINNLAVHPAWRRRRVGEALLIALKQQARAQGAQTATLEVRAGNLAAQRLYGRQGFVEVGRRKNYYRDNGEDALLLTAQL